MFITPEKHYELIWQLHRDYRKFFIYGQALVNWVSHIQREIIIFHPVTWMLIYAKQRTWQEVSTIHFTSLCVSLHHLPELKEHVTLKNEKRKRKMSQGGVWPFLRSDFFFQNAVVWAEAEKVKLLLFEKFSCIWLKQSEIWIYDPDCLWLCVAMLTRYDLFAFFFLTWAMIIMSLSFVWLYKLFWLVTEMVSGHVSIIWYLWVL